ncbi:hypothetical protein GGF32_002987 [Allomyces javanicus]|nr:hypothetical protein GGF32_002987 [Allomyces javanicus]
MIAVEETSGVFVVALTGGPCSGKSTVQTMLSDMLENLNYKVYRVPETATILLSGGIVFSELDEEQAEKFQENLLQVLLQLEQTYIDLAHSNYKNNGQKSVVLCDRGTMDPSAYIPRPVWLRILHKMGLEEVTIRDERYDAVIHMVTAADGAEAFYGNANNATRSEGVELARTLDTLVKNAWIGHPHMVCVDNSTDFDRKCKRVVEALLNRMGMQDRRWGKNIRKHKFLVKYFDANGPFPVEYRDFTVEHRYLVDVVKDGMQVRMRKRFDASGTCHYNLTTRHAPFAGQRVEERRSLNGREYESLKPQTDPSRHVVIKNRRCFIYDNHYYQLDTYVSPCPGLVLMEAYLMTPTHDDGSPLTEDEEAAAIAAMLPPFVSVDREVTQDPAFSMYSLAKKETDRGIVSLI